MLTRSTKTRTNLIKVLTAVIAVGLVAVSISGCSSDAGYSSYGSTLQGRQIRQLSDDELNEAIMAPFTAEAYNGMQRRNWRNQTTGLTESESKIYAQNEDGE